MVTIYYCYLEPEMWNLYEIVVPQIMAHWEEVAYVSLRYKISTVQGIEASCKADPKKCCQALFKNWLTTSNGISPKTWETLLKQLQKVEELTASVEEIKKKISDM